MASPLLGDHAVRKQTHAPLTVHVNEMLQRQDLSLLQPGLQHHKGLHTYWCIGVLVFMCIRSLTAHEAQAAT